MRRDAIVSLREFLELMFGISVGKISVRAVRVPQGPRARKETGVAVDKVRVIIGISWFMGMACLIALGAIVWLAILRPADEVPQILPQVVMLTLGYFGGAFANFARSK